MEDLDNVPESELFNKTEFNNSLRNQVTSDEDY